MGGSTRLAKKLMRVKLITLRFSPSLGGFDETALADFVRDKEVLAVKEHFFCVHDMPHLACLISYQDPVVSAGEPVSRTKAPRVEKAKHAEVSLSPEERVLHGTLRDWRSAKSREEGIPAFVILTNRELIAIIRARPASANALLAIDGIGPAKVKRHGKEILAKLNGSGKAGATP